MKKDNYKRNRRILSIIGIVISSLFILIPLFYFILFFMAFDIKVYNSAAYQFIFAWMINKIIYFALGIFGLIFSIKLFKKNKK